jgi:hypothetical protein
VCGSAHHYRIKSRWSYGVKVIATTLLCATEVIIQSSNLSFPIWYKTMFLMSVTKRGFSAKEIQKQLGVKPL